MRRSVVVLGLLAASVLGLRCASAPGRPAAAHAAASSGHALALPFLEDDYTRALAEARTRGEPLFVEAWAPW